MYYFLLLKSSFIEKENREFNSFLIGSLMYIVTHILLTIFTMYYHNELGNSFKNYFWTIFILDIISFIFTNYKDLNLESNLKLTINLLKNKISTISNIGNTPLKINHQPVETNNNNINTNNINTNNTNNTNTNVNTNVNNTNNTNTNNINTNNINTDNTNLNNIDTNVTNTALDNNINVNNNLTDFYSNSLNTNPNNLNNISLNGSTSIQSLNRQNLNQNNLNHQNQNQNQNSFNSDLKSTNIKDIRNMIQSSKQDDNISIAASDSGNSIDMDLADFENSLT
tara:strand:+ start:6592 stop:7437 length:846 start_codon:yes stop_codon:yes gene_type:complete